jgi:hypothetical protein
MRDDPGEGASRTPIRPKWSRLPMNGWEASEKVSE